MPPANATILVVDDSAEVGKTTSANLEQFGYGVLRCGSSREALRVLTDGHTVDLLLTDIMMPGDMDGVELARHAQAIRPLLPIAYLAGFATLMPSDPRQLLGPVWHKPCQGDELAWHIEELLAPDDDARLVRMVASDMVQRYPDALERALEAEQIDRAKGDELSAQAWQDIAEQITSLQSRGDSGAR